MRRFLLKLWRRRSLQADIETELAFHRDMANAQQNPIGLGNVTLIQEQARDLWRFSFFEDFTRDLWYAARRLRRAPVFTLTALVSLALGIGVNTAIFSLVDTVLVRSLPVERPSELEQVVVVDGSVERSQFSYPVYRELRARSTVFSNLFSRTVTPASLAAANRADRGVIELASGNYFQSLGVRPLLGRAFDDDDDRAPLSHAVVVLAFRYWKERLGADPAIAGKTIRIDNTPFTVIGVAPPGFFGVEVGTLPDAWVPLAMQPAVLGSGRSSFNEPGWSYLWIFGRRREQVSSALAQANLAVLFQQVSQSLPPHLRARRGELHLKPAATGLSRLRETFRDPLNILMSIVGLLLLVTCANLAGVLLARSAARHREMALRLALGARRGRLVRQLLAESLLLGILGGGLGILVSGPAVRALLAFLPSGRLPLAVDARVDARMLGFGLGLSILTGVLFGLVPALQSTRLGLASELKDQRPSRIWNIDLRHSFVAVQIALSMALVSGSLLFIQTLRNAADIGIGLDTGNVVTASVNPALSGYSQPQIAGFYQRLETLLRETPGIRAVGLAEAPLLSGGGDQVQVTAPGQISGSLSMMQNKIGGDFFEAAGISILLGRRFQPTDTPDSPAVAVVNQTAATQLFGSASAVGQKMTLPNGSSVQIVGVARDSRYRSVREETPPILYLSFGQERDPSRERTVYAKTFGDPVFSTAAVSAVIRGIDAHLPVYNLKTLAQQKDESLSRERLTAGLSGLFAALALLLTAIGLYGVMSQTVARRSREIGIRMSLGAARSAIAGMILRDALTMAGMGVGGGLLLDRVLAAAVRSQLLGVAPNDPATLGIACAIQIGIAATASLIPAWKACSIDPALTLRTE